MYLDKVGGWGNEEVHVKPFVDWGVDIVKLDRCRFSFDDNSENYPGKDPRWYTGWDKEDKNIRKAYTTWSKLLKKAEEKFY